METYKNYTPGVPYVRYAGVPFSAPPSPELLSEEVNNFYSGGIRGRRDAEILIISKSMHSNSGLEYPYCSTMPFAIWFNDMLSRCGIPELNIAWATERDIRRSDIMELDPSIILTLSKQGDSWYRSQDLEDYPHAYMTFTPPELWYQHQWNPTNRSPVYPLAAELKHLWSQV
ncbi:MAG: hypothetical protein GY938_13015 [Ketobacter sp.]|nr:hypothetical protein [Ketobacter sp.]